ncbi:MAG: Npun_R2821/Npun_R2822 family protein [Cyanobacteria bacterium P01_H01_bin.162]
MTRGVYFVANDRVFDQAIALLTSLRLQDPDIPVFMVPFDQNYEQVLGICKDQFNIQLFPDLEFLDKLTQDIAEIFPRDFLKLPNKMRKLSLWFGPLDEFVYIDTDILLFQTVQNSLNYLEKADFFCCDFQRQGRGLAEVFTAVVQEQSIFTEAELQDIFNSGFWGGRKGTFSYEEMLALLRECAAHREYFDFSTGTTDQPILNYLVLKATERRVNIAQANSNEPGSWAGSSHFEQKGHLLYDGDCLLRYLHWAGCPMRPDGPYWDLWQSYRFQTVSESLRNLTPVRKISIWERISQKVKALK